MYIVEAALQRRLIKANDQLYVHGNVWRLKSSVKKTHKT